MFLKVIGSVQTVHQVKELLTIFLSMIIQFLIKKIYIVLLLVFILINYIDIEDCEEAICRGLSFLYKLHEQHPDNESIAIKINLFLFSYSNVTRNRIRDLTLLHIQDYAMELKSKFPPIKFLPGVPLNINLILKYIKGMYIFYYCYLIDIL